MRYLDISTAAAIGLLSVASVVVWSPAQYKSEAVNLQEAIGLRNVVFNAVASLGLQKIQDSGLAQLCTSLQAFANSSVGLTAYEGSKSCGQALPSGVVSANLTLQLADEGLTISAWSQERQ